MKLCYVFLACFLVASLGHAHVRIGGSDLLEPHVSRALADFATSRDIDLTVNFAGSYPALDALRKKEIDLAIIAVPEGQEVPGGDLRSVHLAFKALTVVVPQTNPLNQLTLRQLAAVFGEAEATNITRWGQLGLTGEWATRSISLGSVSQQDHTLAIDLFRHQVLQSRGMKRNVAQAPGVEGVRHRLQQDQHGIALLHRIPTNLDGLKVLPLARSDADLAYPPTLEAIANNNYPLRLPLYLVFNRERGVDLRELLRYMVGEEVTEAIVASELAPLSDQQRQALFFEFERL